MMASIVSGEMSPSVTSTVMRTPGRGVRSMRLNGCAFGPLVPNGDDFGAARLPCSRGDGESRGPRVAEGCRPSASLRSSVYVRGPALSQADKDNRRVDSALTAREIAQSD